MSCDDVSNIVQAKQQLIKEMKKNAKRFVFYSIIVYGGMSLGAILFFYVEKCWFLVPTPSKYSKRCQEVCEDILKLNQTFSENTELLEAVENITKKCLGKNCIEEEGNSKTNCNVDSAVDFFEWFELTYSIVYTIGKHNLAYSGCSLKGKRSTTVHKFPVSSYHGVGKWYLMSLYFVYISCTIKGKDQG